MSLVTDVQDQIRRFVVGLVSADDLSDWLDAHAQAIHDDDNSDLRRLTDTTFSLLEDIFQGQRSEDEVQALLANDIEMRVSFSGVLTFGPETVIIETGTMPKNPVTGTSTAFRLSELIVVAAPM